MSAPALACETAVSASISSVASLSTSPSFRQPQWPWLVYSQKHRSVITRMSGTLSLIALTACWMIPSFRTAPEASSSFSSGMPKSRTAGMPRSFDCFTSLRR